VVVYPGISGTNPPLHVFSNSTGAWNNINGTPTVTESNLPDLPLNTVVILGTTSPHTIIVGGAGGVFQTTDSGESWQVLGTGLPHAPVNNLALDASANPPLLRASTFGRGAFEWCAPRSTTWVDLDLTRRRVSS
jgi:hypothetical protein